MRIPPTVISVKFAPGFIKQIDSVFCIAQPAGVDYK